MSRLYWLGLDGGVATDEVAIAKAGGRSGRAPALVVLKCWGALGERWGGGGGPFYKVEQGGARALRAALEEYKLYRICMDYIP
jgi:hypothetical protein